MADGGPVSNYTFSESNNSILAKVPEGCVVAAVSSFVPWDNPDNIVGQEWDKATKTAVNAVSLFLLFLVGVPANILNMVVFYRHGLKERINLCVFSLSFIDMVYMTQAFLRHCDKLYWLFRDLLGHETPSIAIAEKFVFENKLIGLTGFSWASQYLSAIIACERCFCVVSPLRSQTFLQTKTMFFIITLPSLAMLGMFFLVGMKWTSRCVFDQVSNTTTWRYYVSDFYFDNPDLVDAMQGIVFGLVLPLCFIVPVTIATAVTVVKLRKMAAWREQASSAAPTLTARDVALTRMLVGTSVLFIVCATPLLFINAVVLFIPDLSLGGRYNNLHNMLISIAVFFTYVNSSVNFFVYYRFGSKFRETTREVLGCLIPNRKPN